MTETLTINGLSMEPPDLGYGRAWQPIDRGYSEFANSPTLRGDDLVMPGARGQRAYSRVIDATILSLSMMMFGELTPEGERRECGTAYEGLWENRDFFVESLNIGEVVTAVFTRGGSLPVLSGDVMVLAATDWRLVPHLDNDRASASFRLDIKILGGHLDPDESA